MAYAKAVERGLDYHMCHYGGSRLAFRGPGKPIDGGFIGILGGTETFGRFVAEPFPDLLEGRLGTRTVNLGIPNAGIDVYLGDKRILDFAAGGRLTILQVLGAHNLSNRLYRVHPRRNDRFVRATERMCRVYPEVDFTEFHYTRHLLSALSAEAPHRFTVVREELRRCWIARMSQLVARLDGRVILLWTGDRSPDDPADWIEHGEPLFVTGEMVEALRDRVADVVQLPPDRTRGLNGKIFGVGQDSAARLVPGPSRHRAVADALAAAVVRIGDGPTTGRG